MLNKIKVSQIFKNFNLRYFQSSILSRQISKLVQFHSGGDDFCPLKDMEGLGGAIGNNPANGFVFAWRDDVERKCGEGEKRLYAIKKNSDTGEVLACNEIYLKNDGTIELNSGKDLKIVVHEVVTVECQTANIKATSKVNIDSPVTNLGVGGQPIARLGDEVKVKVTSGSSAGEWTGTITSSGVNTSI